MIAPVRVGDPDVHGDLREERAVLVGDVELEAVLAGCQRSLQEVARILRPGGVLVLTTPNAAYLRNRVRLALGRSVYTPLHDWLYGEPHARHAREYTLFELETLVRSAGLELVLAAGRHFYRHTGQQTLGSRASKELINFVARHAPTIGPSLIVVARRPA